MSSLKNIKNSIFRPTDLSKIRSEIDSEKICSFGKFLNELTRMFGNALLFNSSDHLVNNNAREMFNQAIQIVNVSFCFFLNF